MSSSLLSVTAAEVISQNRLRKSFVIGNEDTSIAVFLKLESPSSTTVSATDHDHRLGPGSGLTINIQQDGLEAVKGRWTGVAASGTPRISFFETEDIRR